MLPRWWIDRRPTQRLFRCGALAGPLFVITFTVAGRKRDGYDARRHPVSALALGPGGAVQRANFIATGALYLAAAVGMGRGRRSRFLAAPCPALVAGTGVGLIGSGLFATDPTSGYPPGTPPQPAHPSRTGTIHNPFAIPVFLGIPVTALLSAYASTAEDRRWAVYSATSATLMFACAPLFGAAFAQNPALVATGGRFQRAAIVTGFTWLSALSIAVGKEACSA